jgi:DNA repair ATPase RecN
MKIIIPNNTETINALLETLFDNTPIQVLQETLNDMAKVYSEFKVQQSKSGDSPFLIENSIYQVGVLKELLSSLADIHSNNEKAVNWTRTLQNQQN